MALIATATAIPTQAHAGGVGPFATEYTQLLNYAELVGQLEKQVMMVENQNPDQASPDEMGAWLAKHDSVRQELSPMCAGRRSQAPSDWASTDEGKVCAGVTRATFFSKPKIQSDGKTF